MPNAISDRKQLVLERKYRVPYAVLRNAVKRYLIKVIWDEMYCAWEYYDRALVVRNGKVIQLHTGSTPNGNRIHPQAVTQICYSLWIDGEIVAYNPGMQEGYLAFMSHRRWALELMKSPAIAEMRRQGEYELRTEHDPQLDIRAGR